jgi:RING-like zinc finger
MSISLSFATKLSPQFRRNAVATTKVLAGFRTAVQDILTYLAGITQLENLGNPPINPPAESLLSRYRGMSAFDFKSKSMAEFSANTEYQTIICTPEEAILPANLPIFEQHIKEVVIKRKFAVTSRDQPTSISLANFLKKLSAEEDSNIRLERTFIFADMKRPDSVFSCIGIYLTNGTLHPKHDETLTDTDTDPHVTSREISIALPIKVADGSEIAKGIKGGNSEAEEEECGICLETPIEGEKCAILFCEHWFHQKCISLWF